ATEGYTFESPDGKEHTDLRGALLQRASVDDFARMVIEEPAKLVESLSIIAKTLPVTLILVIDQGEEVLSIGGQRAGVAEASYFRFLALFGESKYPLKLIVALRSDYWGDFVDAINSQSDEGTTIPY